MQNPVPPSSLLNKENLLYQLLKKEYGYYKAIFELAQEENETLKSNQSITALKPLLKKKKILLACINEIETAMIPLKKYWQSKTDRNDKPSEKIKLELNALNQLLKEILQLDLLSQKTMENHLLYLKERNTVLSKTAGNDKP
jgi:hypothetical protein